MARRTVASPTPHAQTQLEVFEPIATNFRQQDQGFDKAYAACESDAERRQLRETLSAAEDAYWAAVADALADNSDFVRQLKADLNSANATVKGHLRALKSVTAYLRAITEATRLAAALARLAAV